MAAVLAILSAFLFALAAALQQKGAFRLAAMGRAVTGLKTVFRLVAVPAWLLGTVALLAGYVTQGVALGKGRLVVVQPLLVLTIVFALPLGHWLTQQNVTRKQVYGAFVVVLGLALFVKIGDPNAGVNSAAAWKYGIAIVAVCIPVTILLIVGSGSAPTPKAAAFGVAAGLLFGLSALFSKATIDELKEGVDVVLSHPEFYGLVAFGAAAIIIQQLSLATGQLAPAMATISVANPFISVVLGALVFEEQLKRPGWHVVLAMLSLLVAFYGAFMITVGNRDAEMPGAPGPRRPERAPAMAGTSS